TSSALKRIGIPGSKITVFSPVLDMKLINSVPHKAKTHTVIYAGRLIKEKRLDLWINAVAKAHSLDSSITGLIIGSGPMLEGLKLMAKPFPFIKFAKPFTAKKELYSELSKSMATLNMSEREGLSAITIESAALGTAPVLPSYTPIPKEVKELAVVADKEKIPGILAKIASGNAHYKPNARRLKSFDSAKINEVFEKLLRI
ncbi:MAG: glycosyltransferase, partial [Candidatus Parvarchaeum sp.]